MVGNTTHVVQIVGWLSIHTIAGLPLPYWLGTWFGIYATWEGVGMQALAGAFVIGSYYLAERIKKARRPKDDLSAAEQTPQSFRLPLHGLARRSRRSGQQRSPD
jgi:high-affinity iron transporter